MSNPTRLIWLDALRLTAGVSMVALHATADPGGQPWADFAPNERIVPIVIRTIVYTARTELFLVISLFLLLMALDRRPRSYATTIGEQARRLLLPYAFWTLFYAFYNLTKAQAFGYLPAIRADLADPGIWAEYLLLGSVKYHMHFLPTLFGLVLAYPLYRMAVRHPALGGLVLVGLVAKHELDGTVFSTFWGTDALPWLVRGVKIVTYAGYGMVAGAALGIWKRQAGQLSQWLPVIGYVAALLVLFKVIAAVMTVQTGAWPFGYLPGYWADFLMPVMLFAAAMCLANRRWPDWIARVAPYSFGIYLCHPIFLDLLEIAMQGRGMGPSEQVLTKIVLAIPATTLLVLALSRLPLLAWTVGLGPLPFRSPLMTPEKT